MENFIHEGYLQDLSLCDRLIAYFHNSEAKIPGATGNGIDPAMKISTECVIEGDILHEYGTALQKIAEEYIKKYPRCNSYAPWGMTVLPKIQHYAPGEGFYGWHTERCSTHESTVTRHLVFLTYLNDVTDGGGTEFEHQKIITSAVKGKTLIWPVDWTYTHRGVVSPTQDKYIVTGWYNFV